MNPRPEEVEAAFLSAMLDAQDAEFFPMRVRARVTNGHVLEGMVIYAATPGPGGDAYHDLRSPNVRPVECPKEF